MVADNRSHRRLEYVWRRTESAASFMLCGIRDKVVATHDAPDAGRSIVTSFNTPSCKPRKRHAYKIKIYFGKLQYLLRNNDLVGFDIR